MSWWHLAVKYIHVGVIEKTLGFSRLRPARLSQNALRPFNLKTLDHPGIDSYNEPHRYSITLNPLKPNSQGAPLLHQVKMEFRMWKMKNVATIQIPDKC